MRRSNAEILQNFQGMVQCKTVSGAELAKINFNEFYRLHRYLEQTYPLIHQNLTREVIGKASLLFHWQGDGTSEVLPIALMAHLDVVPVGDLAKWQHNPFPEIFWTVIFGAEEPVIPNVRSLLRWKPLKNCFVRVINHPMISIYATDTMRKLSQTVMSPAHSRL